MKLYVFAFNPDEGSLIEYFLKYSSHMLLYSLENDKALLYIWQWHRN